jgi:hypothetical protein
MCDGDVSATAAASPADGFRLGFTVLLPVHGGSHGRLAA